jgi:hypothetical protein
MALKIANLLLLNQELWGEIGQDEMERDRMILLTASMFTGRKWIELESKRQTCVRLCPLVKLISRKFFLLSESVIPFQV